MGGDDNTTCYIIAGDYIGGEGICRDKVDGSGAGCGIHGFSGLCCPASDVGIVWFLGGCHRPAATSVVDGPDGKLAGLVGLSPYLDERVQRRTSFRGPALRAKSARRQFAWRLQLPLLPLPPALLFLGLPRLNLSTRV